MEFGKGEVVEWVVDDKGTLTLRRSADGKALVSPDPDAVLAPRDTLILVGPVGVSSSLDGTEHLEKR